MNAGGSDEEDVRALGEQAHDHVGVEHAVAIKELAVQLLVGADDVGRQGPGVAHLGGEAKLAKQRTTDRQ